MFPFLLTALGNAAAQAGMSTIGSGLTSAGTAMGGTAAGTAGSSLPFSFSPPTESLGTLPGGWETTVTKAPTPTQALMDQIMGQAGGGQKPAAPMPQFTPMQAPQMRPQTDVSSLLNIIQSRQKLGT